MSKVAKLLTDLGSVLEMYDRDTIKLAIGDSTSNNRTVTVKQLIRFLDTRRKRDFKKLGWNLSVVYTSVRSEVFLNRSSLRTDAVDIHEFVNFLETYSVPRSVTRQLAA